MKMEIAMEDGLIYIKVGEKRLELASKESYIKLNKDKIIRAKLDEISFKYSKMVSLEIAKMDLKENEKILAEIIVLEKLNKYTFGALKRMCEDIGESPVKDSFEALECMTKVVERMENRIKGQKKIPKMIYELCKKGKGKELSDFVDKTTELCSKETVRLGRSLTKDEVFEICEDVKSKRR